jgi:hypothetical protein
MATFTSISGEQYGLLGHNYGLPRQIVAADVLDLDFAQVLLDAPSGENAIELRGNGTAFVSLDVDNDELDLGTASGAINFLSPTLDMSAASTLHLGSDEATVNLGVAGSNDATLNLYGNATITGNLIVSGATTTVESTTLVIDDNFIVVNDAPSVLGDAGFGAKRFVEEDDAGDLGVMASYDTLVASATADVGGSTTTIVLDSGSSALDDFYNGMWLLLTSGDDNNKLRQITDYDGTTKTATLGGTALSAAPDGDDYSIYTPWVGVIWENSLDAWVLGPANPNTVNSLVGSNYHKLLVNGFESGKDGNSDNADVFLRGVTASKYLQWDASADKMFVAGDADFTGVFDVTGAATFDGGDLVFSPAAGGSFTFANADGALTQAASGGQVTFTGNVDATAGLDVSNSNLTVGGSNFVVIPGSGNTTALGTLTIGAEGAGKDVVFYDEGAGTPFQWDASEAKLLMTGADGSRVLDIADGDLRLADTLYFGDESANGYASMVYVVGTGTSHLQMSGGSDLQWFEFDKEVRFDAGLYMDSHAVSAIDNEADELSTSDSAIATSKAIRDYVDAQVGAANNLAIAGDSGSDTVDLDGDTLTIAGTAGQISTSVASDTATLALVADNTNLTSIRHAGAFDIDVVGAVSVDGATFTVGGDGDTGAIAMDSTAGISLDAAAASNFSTSAGDLDLSAAGSLVLSSSEAEADAVRIVASNAAGGIDIDAGASGAVAIDGGSVAIEGQWTFIGATLSGSGLTIDDAGALLLDGDTSVELASANSIILDSEGGIDIDAESASTIDIGDGAFTITLAGSDAGDDFVVDAAASISLDAAEAAADAIKINASNAAGGIDIDAGTAGIDLGSTGDIHLGAAGEVTTSNVTVTGSPAEGAILALNSSGEYAVADKTSSKFGLAVYAGSGNQVAALPGQKVKVAGDMSGFSADLGSPVYLGASGGVLENAPTSSGDRVIVLGTLHTKGAGAGDGRIVWNPQFLSEIP